MANTLREKETLINWPVTEGLTAGTEKQTGRVMNLIPQGFNGKTSIVEEKDTVGM